MNLSNKHKYKHMNMLSLCVYYDLYTSAPVLPSTSCSVLEASHVLHTIQECLLSLYKPDQFKKQLSGI